MKNGISKKAGALLLASALMATTTASAFALNVNDVQFGDVLTHLDSYSTGFSDKDGGVAEIVAYNSNNHKFYLVNGQQQNIEMVSLADLKDNATPSFSDKTTIDVKAIALEKFNFVVDDITSISVDTVNNRIAVALQAEEYNKNGYVIILDADGNYISNFEVGVQPDMVKFTPDGNYVLTADEGEPRKGFVTTTGEKDAPVDYAATLAAGLEDPKGSVTVINMQDNTSKTADFTAFDAVRDELANSGVLIKKGLNPSTDFEPEYITMVDSKTAYVVLQEANSIATIDIEKGEVTVINPLGFKDHNAEGNALDANKEDKQANIQNEKLMGVYMPDGISSYEVDGKTYILTANEGDGSEWAKKTDYAYCNETDIELDTTYDDDGEIKNVEIDGLNMDMMDGLPALEDGYKGYTFGGRSFSIFEVNTDGSLSLSYDSGSDFEDITAFVNPTYFNTTNDENKIDNRSDNKGPEPENVTTMVVDGTPYAYIGLERVSGVMVYDISNPAKAEFADYINTRNFDVPFGEDDDLTPEMGDISPEGIYAIPAEHSPNGYPLLITGNEVSGTVAVFQQSAKAPDTSEPTVPDTSEPTVPDTSEPTAPDTSEPTVPDTSKPTAPDTSEPTVPDTSEPTAPDTSEPTTPDTSEPTAPDTSEPTAPDTTSPQTGENSMGALAAIGILLAGLGLSVVISKKVKSEQ